MQQIFIDVIEVSAESPEEAKKLAIQICEEFSDEPDIYFQVATNVAVKCFGPELDEIEIVGHDEKTNNQDQ